MTITYNVPTLNGRLAVVVSNIDAGAGNGQLRLFNAAHQTVVLIGLNKPSGTVANAVLTFSGLPLTGPVVLGSQITSADVEDSTNQVVASGLTVGNSTAYDIFMPTTSVLVGQAVSLISATITGR